jgi:hypothetical protein
MTALLRMTWPPAFFFTPVIRGWGDSTFNGAGSGNAAANIRSYLASQFSRPVHVVNQGNGGDPGPAVVARFLARDRAAEDVIDILFFGRSGYNPGGADAYLAALHQCWDDRDSDRLLLCQVSPGATPAEREIGGEQAAINAALRAAIFAEFPAENIIDTMTPMWDAAEADPGATPDDLNARAAGCVPLMFINTSDGWIHRLPTGQFIEAKAMADKIKARGWIA